MSSAAPPQDEAPSGRSIRTLLPRNAPPPKRRLSAFTPSSHEGRQTARPGMLRRGKTVLKRAVSGATGPLTTRRPSSISEAAASAPPATAPDQTRAPLEPLPLSQQRSTTSTSNTNNINNSNNTSGATLPSSNKLDRRVTAPLPRAATHATSTTLSASHSRPQRSETSTDIKVVRSTQNSSAPKQQQEQNIQYESPPRAYTQTAPTNQQPKLPQKQPQSKPQQSNPQCDSSSTPQADPATITRVSRTGLVERSVAAAVISAARNRAGSKKKVPSAPAKPPHHRPHGGFINPWASALRDVGLRARGGHGSRTFFHKVAKDRKPPDEQLATMLLLAAKPDFEEAAAAIRGDKYALASSWIGHSTFVLQMRGLTVLTDPVWSQRLGPLGPKRLVPPPCELDELPEIDVVLLSSACYDHFDKHAVIGLSNRVSTWLVPLGLKAVLLDLGVDKERVVELDWWEEHRVHGSTFVCTPAQHYSVRDDVLWCSWVIGGPHHRAFYCGATGYRAVNRDSEDSDSFEARSRSGGPTCPVFKEISRRYGEFGTALLPIGGFKPRVTMSGLQGDAIDMLFVHRDLRARRSIAHRWGTFACTDEGMLDAVRVLELGLQSGPVPEHEFVYVKHGRLHLT